MNLRTIKKTFLCMLLIAGSVLPLRGITTSEIIAQNLALGFVMNILPERCVNTVSAAAVFGTLNIWQSMENQSNQNPAFTKYGLILTIPSYVTGKILGATVKYFFEEYYQRKNSEVAPMHSATSK